MAMESPESGQQGNAGQAESPLEGSLSETERIRSVYERYDASERAQRKRDPRNRGVQCMRAERWRMVSQILAARFGDAGFIRVLDVGCGEGDDLARIGELLPRAELLGVDLVADRITRARRAVPRARLWAQRGDRLPFRDGSVHVAILSTVLSSILDEEMRQSVASETYRVIREDGLLLVYDIRLPSPWNPDVRAITGQCLRLLLPSAFISAQPITLLPPLARGICGIWPGLYAPLARLSPLRSHYLSVVTKGPSRETEALADSRNLANCQ
jgi:ubiquinone/menaquinone biosynthesis C-methylase UbiE